MPKTMRAKTVTMTIAADPQRVFSLISLPENLPQWNPALCRAVRKEGDGWVVESPRGPVLLRVVREDRAGLVDLKIGAAGAEIHWALRIFLSGEGTEFVATLVQPQGMPDHAFHDHTRWMEKASRELKKVAESHRVARAIPQPQILELRGEEVKEAPVSAGVEASSEAEPAVGGAAPDSKRLFIGNLPFDWNEESLRTHFAGAGQVLSAEVATFGRSGRSRGFGFVEMGSEVETLAAIEQLHGSLAGTRKIVVRVSRPRENRGSSDAAAARPQREAVPDNPESATPDAGNATPSKPESTPAPRRGRTAVRGRFTSRQEHERKAGVIATGEYEFFPRGQSVTESPSSEPEPGNRREPGSRIEASPYMEDTGDIENRGNRAPRHRTGRPVHRRGVRRPPQRPAK